jgi:protein-tyrosine-phosphatase
MQPASILFVCSANSARSPLAVAIWREHSRIPAQSAGTRPAERTHPHAVAAAARHGLALSGAVPRSVDAVTDVPGLIVTVCDEAHEQLAATGSTPRLHWSIPDPVPSGRARTFDSAITALRARIERLSRAVGAAQFSGG